MAESKTFDSDAGVLDALRREPLFELSMSSRELFHSNFISWLIRNHQSAGRVLVGEVLGHPGGPQQLLRVDREKHDVDLHIYSQSSHDIWVEIKIGAVPTARQLTGYATKLSDTGREQRFVLVSLQPLAGLPRPSISRDLACLAAGLDHAADSISPGFQRQLVQHEANLLRGLADLGGVFDPAAHPEATWFPHGDVQARWQLQGRQFRLFAESERPTKRNSVGRAYQYLQLSADVTNSDVLNLLHRETQRLGRLSFSAP